ncbi:MAG: RDD family protein [Niastella sp.]|nr:RDD family protein [Niastella sp.]
MPSISINTVFNINLEFEIAAFHKRLFAWFIDFGLLICYLYSMKYLFYGWMGISMDDNLGIDILLISLPMLLYPLIAEVTMNGQSVGKKIMNIRVVSLHGGEPGLGQYILRWITRFFEWPFLFGYIAYSPVNLFQYIILTCIFGIAVVVAISVTKFRQRIGDIAAGTVLVDTKTNFSVEDTIFQDVSAADYKVMFPEVMRLSDSDINTVKTVLNRVTKSKNEELSYRVEMKVKEVLKIESHLTSVNFLEKLLADYNYLATKE